MINFAGFSYFVRPESYCFSIYRRRVGHETGLHKVGCAKGEAFDLDICGCNNWWMLDVDKSCTSGTGRE